MTRKIFITALFILISFSASFVAADDYFYYQPDFGWNSPIVMAQGGSFVANAHGFDSLIYNPCGYIGDTGDFYISLQGQGIMNIFTLYEDAHGDVSAPNILINQLVTNGFGAGGKLGFGWIGRGIGAAFVVSANSYFPRKDNLFSADGMVYVDAGLVGGYAHNFKLGAVNLGVGGTARIFYRWESNIEFNVVTSLVGDGEIDWDNIPLLGGMAFGFDAGVNVNWRSLTGSVVFRNIGHQWYFFRAGTMGAFLDDRKLPSEKVSERYVTPMNMGIGFEYHPDLGNTAKIVDPRIHLSYEVPLLIGIKKENYIGYVPHSFWLGWHVGAELKLVNVFLFRAGINQGYLTAGLGIDFYVGELSVAIFSREGGRRAGDSQELGCAAELLFRF